MTCAWRIAAVAAILSGPAMAEPAIVPAQIDSSVLNPAGLATPQNPKAAGITNFPVHVEKRITTPAMPEKFRQKYFGPYLPLTPKPPKVLPPAPSKLSSDLALKKTGANSLDLKKPEAFGPPRPPASQRPQAPRFSGVVHPNTETKIITIRPSSSSLENSESGEGLEDKLITPSIDKVMESLTGE